MGAAPSGELLCTAPFRPPISGSRQIALLPFTKAFFPSESSALFQQLYEARMDPSVRYYLRYSGAKELRQDRIPTLGLTREGLFNWYEAASSAGYFATNAEVRAEVAAGRAYRIRPVPCAVVFLYEGGAHVPEGSVRLAPDSDVYVKVIGSVGDTNCFVNPTAPMLPTDTAHIQIYLTKSAGDHNMARVVLLASYIYYHQCVDIIGLKRPPTLPMTYMTFKTNIPMLCFLRELRDRTASLLPPPARTAMWLDTVYIRGSISGDYAAMMIEAYARHFVEFLTAKVKQKVEKQQRRLANFNSSTGAAIASHRHNGQRSMTTEGTHSIAGNDHIHFAAANNTMISSCGNQSSATPTQELQLVANTLGSLEGAQSILEEEEEDDANQEDDRPSLAGHGSTDFKTKITYHIKGYITDPNAAIICRSTVQHEVYVVCADGHVNLVAPLDSYAAPVDAYTVGVGTFPATNAIEGASEARDLVAEGVLPYDAVILDTIAVQRGDVLSFAISDGAIKMPHVKALAESSVPLSESEPTLASQDTFVEDNENHTAPAVIAENYKAALHNSTHPCGRWFVDRTAFLENVMLSLVRDECKNAREADVDDPRWVRDEEEQGPVHADTFYIWRFHRGAETFYYGTVPKFANPTKRHRHHVLLPIPAGKHNVSRSLPPPQQHHEQSPFPPHLPSPVPAFRPGRTMLPATPYMMPSGGCISATPMLHADLTAIYGTMMTSPNAATQSHPNGNGVGGGVPCTVQSHVSETNTPQFVVSGTQPPNGSTIIYSSNLSAANYHGFLQAANVNHGLPATRNNMAVASSKSAPPPFVMQPSAPQQPTTQSVSPLPPHYHAPPASSDRVHFFNASSTAAAALAASPSAENGTSSLWSPQNPQQLPRFTSFPGLTHTNGNTAGLASSSSMEQISLYAQGSIATRSTSQPPHTQVQQQQQVLWSPSQPPMMQSLTSPCGGSHVNTTTGTSGQHSSYQHSGSESYAYVMGPNGQPQLVQVLSNHLLQPPTPPPPPQPPSQYIMVNGRLYVNNANRSPPPFSWAPGVQPNGGYAFVPQNSVPQAVSNNGAGSMQKIIYMSP